VPSATTRSGWLLYLRAGTLMAQAFDSDRLAFAGDPIAVVQRVGSFRDGAHFSASATDVLVYRAADPDSRLTWYDRRGTVSSHASEPGPFRSAAVSPDGTRVVASRTSPQDATQADLWLLDLPRGGAATRLTLGAGLSEYPLWSRDGRRIVFTFNNSTLREMFASGEGEPREVLRSTAVSLVAATDWSPDGRLLLYSEYVASSQLVGSLDIGVLSDRDERRVPFVRTEFDEEQGRFSPNGRWVAFVSNQSGLKDVYVRRFVGIDGDSAGAGASVIVSRGGGSSPRWRGDGRELFYLSPAGKMMAVDVTADQDFQAGTPTALFEPPAGAIVGDVSADGSRFLLVTPTGPSASVFTVVLNWTAGLRKP
jgi:Tol biopolymer transport system component